MMIDKSSKHVSLYMGNATVIFSYQLNIPKGSKPQLRNYLHQIGLWACLWGYFLIAN